MKTTTLTVRYSVRVYDDFGFLELSAIVERSDHEAPFRHTLPIGLFFPVSRLSDSMKPAALLVAGLLLFAPAATAQSQTISCPTVVADTTGWTQHDEGDFSFKLPPRFEEVQARSIDSQVGKWKAGNASIYYDFGSYSNRLDPEEQGSFPRLSVCQEGKGWDTPRIVVYRHEDTGAARMGAHWADSAYWSEGDDFGYSLTIGGAVASAHGFSEMLAVFQSVRIDWEDE